jgi:hypothetical protein
MQINCVAHLWIDPALLNSEPIETGPETEDTFVQHAPGQGSAGAVALAGLATFIVVAIWFAFYLLVFVPRAGAP